MWGFGAWTVYQGLQVDMASDPKEELLIPDSFWGTGVECMDY
jgi:hypothetical protein